MMFNALNKPDSIARQILEAIEYHQQAGTPEIREFHNGEQGRYNKTIYGLQDCNLIQKVESEKNYNVYALTERGLKMVELIERSKELESAIKAVMDC